MAGLDPHSRVREAAEDFFATGMLADKTRQAFAFGEMKGLNLFGTALPWRIELQQNQISGYSETLEFAMRDIHAQLVMLGKSYPFDTEVTLVVDAARLDEPRQRRGASAMSEAK